MTPPPALPLALHDAHLPRPELEAATLDGELRRVGAAWFPVDLAPGPELRASSISRLVPPGLVAEQLTAAWLHGACARLSNPLQLCIRASQRVRFHPAALREVRQVVLSDDELEAVGGVPVTAPFRTAVDLLRWPERFDAGLASAVHTLLLMADAPRAAVDSALTGPAPVPHRRRALARLASLGLSPP